MQDPEENPGYCSTKLSPSEKAEKKEEIYLDLGAIREPVTF